MLYRNFSLLSHFPLVTLYFLDFTLTFWCLSGSFSVLAYNSRNFKIKFLLCSALTSLDSLEPFYEVHSKEYTGISLKGFFFHHVRDEHSEIKKKCLKKEARAKFWFHSGSTIIFAELHHWDEFLFHSECIFQAFLFIPWMKLNIHSGNFLFMMQLFFAC